MSRRAVHAWLAVLAVLAVLAIASLGCAGARPPGIASVSSTVTPTWERPGLGGAVRPEMGSPQPGELAPELALPQLDGRVVSLSSMRGGWVLLHFTATWCPFCDTEIAHLGELAEAFAGRGVKTVVVDVEEDVAAWRAYAATHLAPSVVALHDASGAATAPFAPARAQPSFEDRAQAVLDGTLIIDPEGRIRLFLLPDSAHFDPLFRGVRAELERLVPEPVVTVTAAAPELAAGAHGEITLSLRVAPGYHVMSDRPTEANYIATRVSFEGDTAAPIARLAEATFPVSTPFALGDRTIATFAGSVDVRVPVDVARDATTGPHRLQGTVRYQACTATRCLFPTSRAFEVALRVR